MARSGIAIVAVLFAAGFAGCAATAHSQTTAPEPAVVVSAPASPMGYSDAAPAYRFYPGDEIEVTVFSAPELNRTVTVAPDGRISMPLLAPMRAADLTAAELREALVSAYAPHLRMPELDVAARDFASRQVFVGGEVARPGIYDMPAGIDAFQAVTLAGGFLTSARRSEVLVLSRAPGGESDVREVNLSGHALRAGFPGATPLSRYDVVYVPRSHISHVGLFMQQYVRDALPVNFSLFYDVNGGNRQ
ncbi:MAG: polysaccharide biosynthesis/export family protein [Terricaulis sp.]